ncbi:hypothetical protein [Bacillus sp. FJAT-45066]|uniref:hypothetical protein n=1 Tax=Bacillus sp. FJAT-45066 TaxID=2011010 RepID=UPI000BB7B101|nr:hypothetical protein [Bacillus sp. FJAT-45066]
MRQRIQFLVIFLFSVLLFSACASSTGEKGEYPYGHYEDDKMIGTVKEVQKNENSVVVNISEWEKRDIKGPNITSEGYSYIAMIADETIIKYENGTEASLDDIQKGQKVLVNPPRGNEFEGYPEEIILLDMAYEEKYSGLLSHIDGFNLVVMYVEGEKLPSEMQELVYGNTLDIMKNKEKKIVATWWEYDEDYVVNYKEELDIERFPVMLVFNQEELVFKTYNVDELYDFFKNLK